MASPLLRWGPVHSQEPLELLHPYEFSDLLPEFFDLTNPESELACHASFPGDSFKRRESLANRRIGHAQALRKGCIVQGQKQDVRALFIIEQPERVVGPLLLPLATEFRSQGRLFTLGMSTPLGPTLIPNFGPTQ